MKPISPEKSEARDEGPRLIPLADEDEKVQHSDKLAHYMKLADKALARPLEDEG